MSFNKKNGFLLFLLLFLLRSLYAREITVTVQDKDLQLPLEGAIVRSWDGSSHFCDENGRVLITVPEGRRVSIQVSYPGYETGRLVVPELGSDFILDLQLGDAIESRELVIERARPDTSENRSGRSVAISGEAMEKSSQIGLIEDVMSSIKLLPGVGYSGFFNAMPSIRGGDPEDLIAVLDGFYVEYPYYWGGGFSIFDPHMVASAQLSHGIYSARYGHTISGLLEVHSRKASPDYAELELGISTSAVNLNAAIPLGGKGGLMLMGKVTYWDPFVWTIKQLSKAIDNNTLDMINSVKTAPYIRSAAASFNYRFNSDLEFHANAFLGSDGIGLDFLNEDSDPGLEYKLRTVFKWANTQTFFTSGLLWNPRPDMVIKARAGFGYQTAGIDAKIHTEYLKVNTVSSNYELDGDYIDLSDIASYGLINAQGRIDFDWSLGNGFLLALGIQELFVDWTYNEELRWLIEAETDAPSPLIPPGETYYRQFPVYMTIDNKGNQRFFSSAYVLGEYTGPKNRFGAELGLRVDHLYFRGEDFTIKTKPVFNPRLNLDYNLYRGSRLIEAVSLTAGSGLFSSTNLEIAPLATKENIKGLDIKPNRSWTSVLGIKTDLSTNWSFGIEGFYKYVFDRFYVFEQIDNNELDYAGRFDGDGIVWGFDLMIQKFESRYWNGWLSYTFTHARYHDKERLAKDLVTIEDGGWYYPYYHRFHNLNMVLNFKPSSRINIYTRLGLASGTPKAVVGEIKEYQVVAEDSNGNSKLINKYYRDSEYSDNSRSSWSIPLDIKISFFSFRPDGKVRREMYIAAENLLTVVYRPKANTTFNPYTGREDSGSSDSPDFGLPIPMVSLGVKWSY